MAENMYVFENGDWIVHQYYGVGQVTGIDKKQLEGQTKKYLKVNTANSVYWLPVHANSERVRPVSSPHTFRNVLGVIRKAPKEIHENYKQRQKMISARLAEGTLISVARLIRDLAGRSKRKDLNMSERDLFEKLKKQFCHEMAISTFREEIEVDQLINEALRNSTAKMEIVN